VSSPVQKVRAQARYDNRPEEQHSTNPTKAGRFVFSESFSSEELEQRSQSRCATFVPSSVALVSAQTRIKAYFWQRYGFSCERL